MSVPGAGDAAGQPRLPQHGVSTLAEVLPAVAAHLGAPGFGDALGLPDAERYVFVLVDGLGHRLLQRHLRDAPYLAEVFGDVLAITSGVPSTTATSITSLGTGLPSGQHGIVGWSFRRPDTGRRMNSLTWDQGPDDVEAFQPSPTVFERLADSGVACTSIGMPRFDGTGLTRAALRGARYVGIEPDDPVGRLDAIVDAATSAPRTLTYVYERRLDHTGHGKGCESEAWLRTLGRIDDFLGQLRDRLPDDVCLLITGDHGMVDVPASTRIQLEEHPGLRRGVDMVAGEARLRQLYTSTPDAVARRWADELGERAWVRTRDQAVAEGWFGPSGLLVAEHVEPRFGDVLVAMRGTWAVLTEEFPAEQRIVGMHGSLTPEETEVPLLVDHPASEGVWPRG